MGYFKVDRQIFEHWLWESKPFSKGQAWIDLIGLTNYEDKKVPYKGDVIVCKRGTVNRSISYLAKRWGWSRDKARTFLRMLESDGMVTVKATTNQTTITLLNYGKFQDSPSTDSSTNRQRTSQRADSESDKEKRIYKNDKEGEKCPTTRVESDEEILAFLKSQDEAIKNAKTEEERIKAKYGIGF